MQRFKLAMVSMIASLAVGGAGLRTCAAQSPQAPNYGNYASAQTPAQAAQLANACQPSPTPGCQNVKYGCGVTVCTCPCDAKRTCDEINALIPKIHTPPTCAEVPFCDIVNEGPPTAQCVTIPIYRNCYVPIKIRTVEGPGPDKVTPVNIQVNWREVHVLCDAKGVPLPSAQAAAILKELNSSMASAGAPTQGAVDAPTATPTPAVNPAAPPTVQSQPAASAGPATVQATDSAPAAPVHLVSQVTDAKKQWVWLTQEGVYGYGYQRGDGYWEIDPNSRRATLQQ